MHTVYPRISIYQTKCHETSRIHFFHEKEELMRHTRKNSPLPDPYADISVYSDISQHTMQARRNLATLTKLFQNHKLPYTWGFSNKNHPSPSSPTTFSGCRAQPAGRPLRILCDPA